MVLKRAVFSWGRAGVLALRSETLQPRLQRALCSRTPVWESGNFPRGAFRKTLLRSSGPGGQNVNNVNTKVEIRFSLRNCDWLETELLRRLEKKFSNRVNRNGDFVVSSDRMRHAVRGRIQCPNTFQIENEDDCYAKLREMVAAVAKEEAFETRKPTEVDEQLIAQKDLRSRLLEPDDSEADDTLMVRHDVQNNRTADKAEAGVLPPLRINGREHEHDHSTTLQAKTKKEMRSQRAKLIVMIAMTFFFFIVELVYGYISNSMALIADSFHMLSDVLALLVALACIMIANRKSKTNTFGWVRAELLGALVNGVFLLALCFSIFLEGIERLLNPEPLREPLNVLIVGILGLIVNIIGMFLFHGHSHSHKHGKHHHNENSEDLETSYLATSHQDGAMVIAELKNDDDESSSRQESNGDVSDSHAIPAKAVKNKNATQMNMKGVYLHIVTDFIGSIIVILTASISLWLPHWHLFKNYMDPVLSMVMVILIMSSTIPLVRETALILLQTTPDDVDVGAIEMRIMALPGILAIHEFHVWRLVGLRIIATMHIHFATFEDYLRNAEPIRKIFHENLVHSVTVQPEFTVMRKESFGCALKCEPEDCQAATCCQSNSLVSTPRPLEQTPPTDRSKNIA